MKDQNKRVTLKNKKAKQEGKKNPIGVNTRMIQKYLQDLEAVAEIFGKTKGPNSSDQLYKKTKIMSKRERFKYRVCNTK